MSSHHIVRDKQEPALIIANGQACSDKLLNELLEWSPFVLVLDGALERVLMKQIKVDAVLGDFDSIGINEAELSHSEKVEWLERPDQNKTDLEKGLDHLIDLGYSDVNILWATGRRLDHSWNNILTISRYHSRIGINLIDDHSKMFICPRNFTKYYIEGFKLSLIPVVDCKNIKTKGLKYNLNNEDLNVLERTSSSNSTIENGLVNISYTSGLLSLIESFD